MSFTVNTMGACAADGLHALKAELVASTEQVEAVTS